MIKQERGEREGEREIIVNDEKHRQYSTKFTVSPLYEWLLVVVANISFINSGGHFAFRSSFRLLIFVSVRSVVAFSFVVLLLLLRLPFILPFDSIEVNPISRHISLPISIHWWTGKLFCAYFMNF